MRAELKSGLVQRTKVSAVTSKSVNNPFPKSLASVNFVIFQTAGINERSA